MSETEGRNEPVTNQEKEMKSELWRCIGLPRIRPVEREDNLPIECGGSKYWYKNGKLHRDFDLPAIEFSFGAKVWYQNGEVHRENGPAIVFDDSAEEKSVFYSDVFKRIKLLPFEMDLSGSANCWVKYGLIHRELDEPAIECQDGSRYWYKNGMPCRKGDKPSKILADGTKIWHKHGITRRKGEFPAKEYGDGTKIWYKYGVIHRENGPAIECRNGAKIWFFYGKIHRDDDSPAIICPNGYKEIKKYECEHGRGLNHEYKYDHDVGFKSWYQNGILHRDDYSPAIMYTDGRKDYVTKGNGSKKVSV